MVRLLLSHEQNFCFCAVWCLLGWLFKASLSWSVDKLLVISGFWDDEAHSPYFAERVGAFGVMHVKVTDMC